MFVKEKGGGEEEVSKIQRQTTPFFNEDGRVI
jgi:hypothetical protein